MTTTSQQAATSSKLVGYRRRCHPNCPRTQPIVINITAGTSAMTATNHDDCAATTKGQRCPQPRQRWRHDDDDDEAMTTEPGRGGYDAMMTAATTTATTATTKRSFGPSFRALLNDLLSDPLGIFYQERCLYPTSGPSEESGLAFQRAPQLTYNFTDGQGLLLGRSERNHLSQETEEIKIEDDTVCLSVIRTFPRLSTASSPPCNLSCDDNPENEGTTPFLSD
ncbi:hypothetical protein EDB83DRAFT_2547386 [Lactarius deliciosus]|nr:hypothetical protein EDB83DRAFT_2547386 [Lactarius deliciosus]